MNQDETNIDPIFKVPSCSGRSGGGIASGADSPECHRANETHSRGKALRHALFGRKKEPKRDGSTPPRLLQKEISRRGLEYATYITSTGSVDPYTERLRRVLPLISEGDLRDSFDGPDAPLYYLANGTEATVFIDRQKKFVYKLTPIDENILDVPYIADDSPVYAKLRAHPLCDQFGDITIFQRNLIYNLLPGLAKTELLAITASERVVTKQPYLGDTEPTQKELSVWAERHGYHVLPPQADDPIRVPGSDLPETEGASSAMPLLYHHEGVVYLGVDVVPRNARKLPNGEIYVFDWTARPIYQSEIEANPEIKNGLDVMLAFQNMCRESVKSNPVKLPDPRLPGES